MTTDDKIIIEIYRRMYKEAEPKANIDKIIKSGEGKKPNWFMKYYLDQKRQDEIMNEVLKEFKVPKRRWEAFRTECLLGSSPTGIKKTMLKEKIK